MSNLTLGYLHLCDGANIDPTGKVNILGIFNKLYLPSVPSTFLKFVIVSNILIKSVDDKEVKVEIKIFSPENKELEIKPPIALNFNLPEAKADNDGEINLLLEVGNLEFNNFGKHIIKVFVDSQEIGSKNLLVEERKEDINI